MLKNILLFIHGITPEANPPDPMGQYNSLLSQLRCRMEDFDRLFAKDQIVYIKWGALYAKQAPVFPDEKLDKSETEAGKLTSDLEAYESKDAPRNNWSPQLRIIPGIDGIKLNLVVQGLADALYYAAPDGEAALRRKIYVNLMDAIKPFLDAGDPVRLHFITHSLGVTIGHDFCFGLFNTLRDPSFIKEDLPGRENPIGALREYAKKGQLTLGSYTAMASQLPLFVMRNKDLVEDLYAGKRMNPVNIGVKASNEIMVKFFYNPDDLLGFPSRGLYEPNENMQDIRVATGLLPTGAHTGYWENEKVADHVAQMLKIRTK